MAQLKGGHAADIANSMAEAIEVALQQEWPLARGVPLPPEGMQERRIVFVAIARGVLQYLKDHQHEFINSMTLNGTPQSVTNLDLNISA